MHLIAGELFRLQARDYESLSSVTSRKADARNANSPESPMLAIGSLFLFYYHRPGGHSEKLASTWPGLYQVIHCQLNKYSLAAFITCVVVNKLHRQYLPEYPLVKS